MMVMKSGRLLVGGVLIALSLLGCGGGGAKPPPSLTSIAVTPPGVPVPVGLT